MAENAKIMIINEKSLREKIYTIRGQQVMLDFDLAEIYGYSVSAFNQQVKRNIERFPEDFSFILTIEEMIELSKSQNVITIQLPGTKGGRTKPVRAFTEQGVYMLMTVLKGDLAIEQSKTLIRLFKGMKDYLIENQPLISQRSYTALVERVEEHSREIKSTAEDVKEIKDTMVTKADLSDFMKLFDGGTKEDEILILNGQPLKADIAYQRIYRKANKSIVVVDDYIGVKTLQHLAHAKRAVKLTVVSDNKSKRPLRASEYADFRKEYRGREVSFVRTDGKVHDRYILIDNEQVFHCGTSSKDAGSRITTITKLNDGKETIKMVRSLFKGTPLDLA